MAALLWEYLIISIVSLFGINIGLALGLTKLNKFKILIYSIVYGGILFIISIMANLCSNYFYALVNSYISEIVGIIGIGIIISGIYSINKWKQTKKEFYSLISVANVSSSICCFVGVMFGYILLSKNIDTFVISIAMSLALFLLIISSYFFSNFLRYAEKPYPVLLGNFMILNGLYFVAVALFIPTVNTLSSIQMNPLSIISNSSAIFLVLVFLGVFLLGVYLKKENITSLKDFHQE